MLNQSQLARASDLYERLRTVNIEAYMKAIRVSESIILNIEKEYKEEISDLQRSRINFFIEYSIVGYTLDLLEKKSE